MLHIALVFLLAFLSTGKVIIQGRFSRKMTKNTLDVFVFNTGMFGSVALCMLFVFRLPKISPLTFLLGAVFGILSVFFQMLYMRAMRMGAVSLTTMAVHFAIVFPIVFCIFAYGEVLSLTKAIGILLLIPSAILLFRPEQSAPISRKWLLLLLIIFPVNGVSNIVQKIHQHTAFHEEVGGFVLSAYAVAAVLSLVLSLYRKKVFRESMSFRISPRTCAPMLLVGVVLGAFQALFLYLTGQVDAVVLYPVQTSATIILSVLSGVFLFGDRLDKKKFLGVFLGICSILAVGL